MIATTIEMGENLIAMGLSPETADMNAKVHKDEKSKPVWSLTALLREIAKREPFQMSSDKYGFVQCLTFNHTWHNTYYQYAVESAYDMLMVLLKEQKEKG